MFRVAPEPSVIRVTLFTAKKFVTQGWIQNRSDQGHYLMRISMYHTLNSALAFHLLLWANMLKQNKWKHNKKLGDPEMCRIVHNLHVLFSSLFCLLSTCKNVKLFSALLLHLLSVAMCWHTIGFKVVGHRALFSSTVRYCLNIMTSTFLLKIITSWCHVIAEMYCRWSWAAGF